MITRQHASLFAMELMTKLSGNLQEFEKEFEKRIPFVLLPDAIRAYVGPRQASHFEYKPDGTDISWMEFPSAMTLKNLSKETVSEAIKYYVADGIPKCIIGEESSIPEFDRRNYGHQHYHSIRIHLLQDMSLDRMLRKELVDCTDRFKDRFVMHHNHSIVLDGNQLRKQLSLFEELGFIHLVGKVHERTGMLLTGEWFDKNVMGALLKAYPEDLAIKTYSYMKYPSDLDERIRHLDFELTEEEKASVLLTDDLITKLDELYSDAGWYTYVEI